MEKLKAIIRWIQFLVWAGLWLWSAITDDPNQPWRMMFSVACCVNAFDRAFNMGSWKQDD